MAYIGKYLYPSHRYLLCIFTWENFYLELDGMRRVYILVTIFFLLQYCSPLLPVPPFVKITRNITFLAHHFNISL